MPGTDGHHPASVTLPTSAPPTPSPAAWSTTGLPQLATAADKPEPSEPVGDRTALAAPDPHLCPTIATTAELHMVAQLPHHGNSTDLAGITMIDVA